MTRADRSVAASRAQDVRGAPGSEILCVGEILWDALSAGLFLGGAAFNVACHLRRAASIAGDAEPKWTSPGPLA